MDPELGRALIRLSQLHDAKVRTTEGKSLGRVHDVHVENGRVVALACGPGGFIERLTAKSHGRRIAWTSVKDLRDGEVIVVPDPSEWQPGASRNRKGTRQASGQRSKR